MTKRPRNTKTTASKDRWETLRQDLILDRSPYVQVFQEQVRTSSGLVIDDYYRVGLSNFVVCIPVTPDGRILVLWQYKHGPRAYVLTFPAGAIDPGEEPSTACTRELLEETGYAAAPPLALGNFIDHGNQGCGRGYYFLARDCTCQQAAQSGDLEDMDLQLMSPAEIDEAIAAGNCPISHHALAWLLAKPHLS